MIGQTLNVRSITPAGEEPALAGVERVEYGSHFDGAADWAVMERSGEDQPWAVVLHGHGSDGEQLYRRPDIRDGWLPILRRRGFGILSPNLRGNAWMGPAAVADLHDLLRWLRRVYRATSITLVGGSMGGTGVLIYTCQHPGDVDAAVVMCPATDVGRYYQWCHARDSDPVLREIIQAIESGYGGTPTTQVDRFQEHSACRHAGRLTMPLSVVHGDADDVIPVEESRAFAAAMTSGKLFTYEELRGGNHDAPLATMETQFSLIQARLAQVKALDAKHP